MKNLLFSVLLAFGIMSLAMGQQASQAKDADWVKIGETTINLSEDYGIFDWDRDRVETVNANEKYSAVKFKAKDAKVSLTNVEVQYANGKKEELKVNTPIDAKTESKQFPLDTRQELDQVTFNFLKDETAGKDKTVVEIWGLKSGAAGMGKGTDTETDIDVDVDIDTTNKRR